MQLITHRMQEVQSYNSHSISPRLQSLAPRHMRRIADYHPRDTRGRPVGTFQSSSILQPGRLSIFPTMISRRGPQLLNTDPRKIGDYTLTTLIPFRSSLPTAPSAPARTLIRVACLMAIFLNSHMPLMRRIPEGPLMTYGVRSCAPFLDRKCQVIHWVASVHR